MRGRARRTADAGLQRALEELHGQVLGRKKVDQTGILICDLQHLTSRTRAVIQVYNFHTVRKFLEETPAFPEPSKHPKI